MSWYENSGKITAEEVVDMKMIFKTTDRYGKYMVPRIIFMGTILIITLIGMLNQLLKYKYKEEILPYFMTAFAGFAICFLIIKYIPRWFLYMYTVELYEDKLTGYNLFGRKQEFQFKDIKNIGRSKSIYNVGYDEEIVDVKENAYRINGDIDYAGFILDYIIERCKDTAKIDYKFLDKRKERPSSWKYTRRMPFDTKYDDGYLEWLEPVVNAQKEKLIARGDLKPEVLYGDDVKKLLWVKKER